MRISTGQNTFISPIDKYGRITNEQILIIAKCLSNKSIIKTPLENKELGKIQEYEKFEVISYEFENKKEVIDYAMRIKSGKKVVYELETESGNKIIASKDHIFFVKQGNKIIEKKLEDLNEKDRIITF